VTIVTCDPRLDASAIVAPSEKTASSRCGETTAVRRPNAGSPTAWLVTSAVVTTKEELRSVRLGPPCSSDARYFLLTWRLAVTLCVRLPLMPLIVSAAPPVFVVDVVATESVGESDDGTSTGFWLNVAVEFAGS
jgi:hypothetical protein